MVSHHRSARETTRSRIGTSVYVDLFITYAPLMSASMHFPSADKRRLFLVLLEELRAKAKRSFSPQSVIKASRQNVSVAIQHMVSTIKYLVTNAVLGDPNSASAMVNAEQLFCSGSYPLVASLWKRDSLLSVLLSIAFGVSSRANIHDAFVCLRIECKNPVRFDRAGTGTSHRISKI